MPDERLSPSPSSADVSLPSSALSTSGAAETITVGMSEAVRVDLLDWPMVDGGEAGGGLDRSLVSKAVGEPVERPRAAAKLSMDPSSDE